MPQLNSQIISDAFVKAGVCDQRQGPDNFQSAIGLTLLNDNLLKMAADGVRVGWYTQTNLAATAPLRDESISSVKYMLCKWVAEHYKVIIKDPTLAASIADAERFLTKNSIKYFESDLGELQRPQGGPWGGPNWF